MSDLVLAAKEKRGRGPDRQPRRREGYGVHGHCAGGRVSAEYRAYRNMISRCHDEQNKRYGDYGARGITVCPEWLNNFPAFYSYVGPRPSSRHSLDRIDNDKGYGPGNVKWSTRSEQQRNTRRSRLVTAFGETRGLAEWANRVGMLPSTLHARIFCSGMDAEMALTAPVISKAASARNALRMRWAR